MAKARIESLNPLVAVEAVHDLELDGVSLDTLVSSVDLVCITDSDSETLVSPIGYSISN